MSPHSGSSWANLSGLSPSFQPHVSISPSFGIFFSHSYSHFLLWAFGVKTDPTLLSISSPTDCTMFFLLPIVTPLVLSGLSALVPLLLCNFHPRPLHTYSFGCGPLLPAVTVSDVWGQLFVLTGFGLQIVEGLPPSQAVCLGALQALLLREEKTGSERASNAPKPLGFQSADLSTFLCRHHALTRDWLHAWLLVSSTRLNYLYYLHSQPSCLHSVCLPSLDAPVFDPSL